MSVAFVDEQVRERGYGTYGEYMRALIRRDHDRPQLRGLLPVGASSAVTAPLDRTYFEA